MIKTSELIWQDTQHQMLFKLIDDIKIEPFEHSVLVKLQLYAEHHFSLEESYMVKLDYPDTADHINTHDRFREELEAMVNAQDNLDRALQDTLSLFLSEWLRLHVLGVDKKLEEFILESDSK
ncbi:MAG: hemerythrin family protein [Gammaproteobacteria bacterium]|nr:hemerythrin family protein [Gammaproteobacteria bacterium]